ncbi:hypothetical protein BGZ57DRAFT_859249 [Hyaloscypha finlandica]|nr:hypothetical protein BGZ57DRAFT_859249 [Hyaloscypha finlandica]
MALAPGPKPLPQPTHLALPACLCLLSATSSTPALPEEHPRAHMSSLCGRCSGRWAPSKQQVFHQRQPTTIGRVPHARGAWTRIDALSSPPPRLTRRLFACYQYLAPWKCPKYPPTIEFLMTANSKFPRASSAATTARRSQDRAKIAIFLNPGPVIPPTKSPARPCLDMSETDRVSSLTMPSRLVSPATADRGPLKMLILALNPPNKLFDLIRSHHVPVCRKLGESQGSRRNSLGHRPV